MKKQEKSNERANPRRQWTWEEKKAFVLEFEASGLERAAFCRKKDLWPSCLARWQKQFRTPLPDLAEVAQPEEAFSPVKPTLGSPQPSLTKNLPRPIPPSRKTEPSPAFLSGNSSAFVLAQIAEPHRSPRPSPDTPLHLRTSPQPQEPWPGPDQIELFSPNGWRIKVNGNRLSEVMEALG